MVSLFWNGDERQNGELASMLAMTAALQILKEHY
jgi:hypothetical protein